MNNKTKGLIGLAGMVIVGAAVIFASNPIMETIKKAEESKKKQELEIKQAMYKDGVYHAEDAEFVDGYKGSVDMVVENGIITSVVWENVDENGVKKSQLAAEGKYVMTETGLNWKEQAEALAAYVVGHQGTEGLANAEGKTDVVSGVSIYIGGFAALAEDCLKQASPSALTDGTYHAEDAEFVDGYKGSVDMVVENGIITSVVWENVDESGVKKSQLAAEGKYVMTETGLNWKEQAEALAAYVLEHQGTEGLANAEGKTDVVSGVSIYIGGFVALAEDCLKQAGPASYKDGAYHAEGKEFVNGYKGSVDITVENGAITSVVWENVDESGAKKSQLAAEGKYVMTETGLNWKEQAEALGAYVLEHQGLSGLTTNDEGKTDVVSGVSISIQEFISLTEECLKQAE